MKCANIDLSYKENRFVADQHGCSFVRSDHSNIVSLVSLCDYFTLDANASYLFV